MLKDQKYRYVETFQDHFEKFFVKQDQKVKNKIIWTLELIEDIEIVPKLYLDNIDGKLYEIRVKQGSNIFRIFCFFDNHKLIVLMNGFRKKTQKTPRKQIQKAKSIMKEYFESKTEKDET